MEICQLKELRVLSVQRNRLVRLPSMGLLPNLIELKIGYNQIEVLEEDIFMHLSGVAGTLKLFECSENNLQELPCSTTNLHPECLFSASFNPLISPPQEILKDGLKNVQEYLRVRVLRRKEILDLLWNQDFEVILERTHPVASDGNCEAPPRNDDCPLKYLFLSLSIFLHNYPFEDVLNAID